MAGRRFDYNELCDRDAGLGTCDREAVNCCLRDREAVNRE